MWCMTGRVMWSLLITTLGLWAAFLPLEVQTRSVLDGKGNIRCGYLSALSVQRVKIGFLRYRFRVLLFTIKILIDFQWFPAFLNGLPGRLKLPSSMIEVQIGYSRIDSRLQAFSAHIEASARLQKTTRSSSPKIILTRIAPIFFMAPMWATSCCSWLSLDKSEVGCISIISIIPKKPSKTLV